MGGTRTRAAVLGAALALLAALGAWFWFAGGRTEPRAAPALVADDDVDPASVDERGEERSRAARAPASTSAAEDGAEEHAQGVEGRAWIVRGRTVLASRKPLAEAPLELALYDGPSELAPSSHREMVRSDAEGRFMWSLPRAPATSVLLRARGASADHGTTALQRRIARGEAPPDDLVLVFEPLDFAIRGTVTCDAGPLAGATVRTRELATTTDAAGRYELKHPSTRPSASVEAFAPGFALKRALASIGPPGGVAPLDFALEPALRVHGVVRDEKGVAIAGAVIRTSFAAQNAVHTDELGRYALDHLDPARPSHTLHAQKPGFVPALLEIDARGARELEQSITLHRGARVAGVCVDPSSAAVEGVELEIGREPGAFDALEAWSGIDGRFEFSGVPGDAPALFVQREGFASQRIALDAAAGDVQGLRILLQPGRSIAGRLLDERGAPCPGIGVRWTRGAQVFAAGPPSDAEGRFRCDGLPAAEIALLFDGPGYLAHEERVAKPAGAEIIVRLQRGARLAGRVVDDASGQPLDDFTVRLELPRTTSADDRIPLVPHHWSADGKRFTGTSGWWETRETTFAPGARIAVLASAPGFAPELASPVVLTVEPDPERLVLRLRRAASIEGRVVSFDGSPRSGARVLLEDRTYAAEKEQTIGAEHRGVVLTHEDGGFRFEHASPGTVRLRVEMPGRPAHVDGPFEVEAGGTAQRRIELVRGLIVRGEVRDAVEAGIAGAEISFRALEAPERVEYERVARSDERGAFAFDDAPPGAYWIAERRTRGEQRIEARGRRVDVLESASVFVVLAPSGALELRGILRIENKKPPALLAVHLERKDGEASAPATRCGTFAEDGRFTVRELEAGTYRVRVRHDDAFGTWIAEAELEAGLPGAAEHVVELRLLGR